MQESSNAPAVPFPNVLLISGTSSSGKTSLAKLLQAQLPVPYMHAQLDAFIEMMPPISNGDMFMQMVRGFHASVVALLNTGHRVILDHVVIEPEWLEELQDLFKPHGLVFIGLHCSLDELERREKFRDAKRQGFARQQFNRIHVGKTYDLTFDTGTITSQDIADQIIKWLEERGKISLQ